MPEPPAKKQATGASSTASLSGSAGDLSDADLLAEVSQRKLSLSSLAVHAAVAPSVSSNYDIGEAVAPPQHRELARALRG